MWSHVEPCAPIKSPSRSSHRGADVAVVVLHVRCMDMSQVEEVSWAIVLGRQSPINIGTPRLALKLYCCGERAKCSFLRCN